MAEIRCYNERYNTASFREIQASADAISFRPHERLLRDDGALRFDPDTQKFTEYKTITHKTANGTGVTYGAAADRNGNGYWAVMIHDIIGVGDGATGKASEIKRR